MKGNTTSVTQGTWKGFETALEGLQAVGVSAETSVSTSHVRKMKLEAPDLRNRSLERLMINSSACLTKWSVLYNCRIKVFLLKGPFSDGIQLEFLTRRSQFVGDTSAIRT